MNKLIMSCCDEILRIAYENELNINQLDEIFETSRSLFNESAIIPKSKEHSRSYRECSLNVD